MFCVHARKRTSGAPRTHFRACKISNFWGRAPRPPRTILILGPHSLYLPCMPPHNPLGGPGIGHQNVQARQCRRVALAIRTERASWSRSQATSRMHLPGSILCVLCPVSLLISHFCYVSCLFVFCFFVQKGNTSIGYSFCVPCIMQIIQTSRLIYHGSLGMRL